MSKSTPGPWASPQFSGAPFSVWQGNTQIAACRWTDDDGDPQPECVQDEHEAKANAVLIAAAPDGYALALAVAAHFADTDAPLGQMARDFLKKVNA